MYKRIVLKLSGEALAGEKKGVTFDDSIIWGLIAQIKAVMAKGTQVSLVIGGGNFWRGRSADSKMDRTKADQIGMLATVMNAIYVADAFRQNGIKAFVQTPIVIGTMTEQFSKESALAHLEKGEVVIFAAGMGHPFFSTDTITALSGDCCRIGNLARYPVKLNRVRCSSRSVRGNVRSGCRINGFPLCTGCCL